MGTLVLPGRHVANAATKVLNVVADFLDVRRIMILVANFFACACAPATLLIEFLLEGEASLAGGGERVAMGELAEYVVVPAAP